MKFERKDFYWLIGTLISIAAVVAAMLIFVVSPPASKPPKDLLSLEFHRIKASETTALLFKMMEGATLEYSKGFSWGDHKQYWVSDGTGEHHGLVTENFKDIYQKWHFAEHKPVNLEFWKRISGSQVANNFVGFLNAAAIAENHKEFQDYVKYYMCFYQTSTWNDGGGLVFSGLFKRLYGSAGDGGGRICSLMSFDPYNYYYTGLTIENNTDKVINDIKISYEVSMLSDQASYIYHFTNNIDYSECLKLSKAGSYEATKLRSYEASQECEADLHSAYFKRVNKEKVLLPKQSIQKEGSISTLAPGNKLFILLNAYHPDGTGLPKAYLYAKTVISKISYTVESFGFTEQSVKPLGEKRLGIITSPSGGIGGQ